MEPTAFICLTDVIQPVRHIVKDGVSTMEQGSDAYLDWVCCRLDLHDTARFLDVITARLTQISSIDPHSHSIGS